MRHHLCSALICTLVSAAVSAADLTFENEAFRLVVGEDAVAKSLVVKAALVATPGPERFLDSVQSVEDDFGLPKGVASRRSGVVNASVYWVGDLDPANVDEHVCYAKEGGFSRMLVYHTAMCKDGTSYYRGRSAAATGGST